VSRWIRNSQLESVKIGRITRVSQESLDSFLEHSKIPARSFDKAAQGGNADNRQGPRLGASAMSRREFLRESAAGAIGGIVAFVVGKLWEGIEEYQEKEAVKIANRIQAKELFQDLFGRLGPTRYYSLGKQTYPKIFHPDNLAAGLAVVGPLGLIDSRPIVVPQDQQLDIQPNGDLVLIGGPNSTPLTTIAWEFEGVDDRQLIRRPNPIIPLRYYGISDATDPSLNQDVRIGWNLEGVGPVSTVNWPFVDTRTGRRLRPTPGDRISVPSGDAYLPWDNYLLVTRMPNYLTPNFLELVDLDPNMWPRLLVFEGSHGPGTRAVQLLLTSAGLAALTSAKSALGQTEIFQLLFRTKDLDISEEGYHEYHSIELIDAISLEDSVDIDSYIRAHKYANERIHQLTHLTSV